MPRLATTVDELVEAEFLLRARQLNLSKHEYLREIIYRLLVAPRPYPNLIPDNRSSNTEHLSVRLPAFQADEVRQRAAHKGMSASRWMSALIQSHLMREPVLNNPEIEIVRESNYQVQMIGRLLNQIARAMNANLEGIDSLKLETIKALVEAINANAGSMQRLVQHSQNYWEADPC